jgi:hypothetical protein
MMNPGWVPKVNTGRGSNRFIKEIGLDFEIIIGETKKARLNRAFLIHFEEDYMN